MAWDISQKYKLRIYKTNDLNTIYLVINFDKIDREAY